MSSRDFSPRTEETGDDGRLESLATSMRFPDFDGSSVVAFGPGDVLVILSFVAIGEVSHGVLPWSVPLRVASTAGTFLLGWILFAPVVGAYRSKTMRSRRWAVGTAVLTWVGADVIAQGIRSTSLVHGNASMSFFVVAAISGGAMLAVWRFLRSSFGG